VASVVLPPESGTSDSGALTLAEVDVTRISARLRRWDGSEPKRIHTSLFRHTGNTTASGNHPKQEQIKKHTTKIYTQNTIENTTKTHKKIILPE